MATWKATTLPSVTSTFWSLIHAPSTFRNVSLARSMPLRTASSKLFSERALMLVMRATEPMMSSDEKPCLVGPPSHQRHETTRPSAPGSTGQLEQRGAQARRRRHEESQMLPVVDIGTGRRDLEDLCRRDQVAYDHDSRTGYQVRAGIDPQRAGRRPRDGRK